MTKAEWKRKIKANTKKAGTYRPFFEPVIETLAGIMEARDFAQQKWEEEGKETVVKHVNKAGAENIVKHPALVVINDMNRDALAYWRDLGLTPAGLKRINEEAMEAQKPDQETFADVLKNIGV
jgi:hypothetical protein